MESLARNALMSLMFHTTWNEAKDCIVKNFQSFFEKNFINKSVSKTPTNI